MGGGFVQMVVCRLVGGKGTCSPGSTQPREEAVPLEGEGDEAREDHGVDGQAVVGHVHGCRCGRVKKRPVLVAERGGLQVLHDVQHPLRNQTPGVPGDGFGALTVQLGEQDVPAGESGGGLEDVVHEVAAKVVLENHRPAVAAKHVQAGGEADDNGTVGLPLTRHVRRGVCLLDVEPPRPQGVLQSEEEGGEARAGAQVPALGRPDRHAPLRHEKLQDLVRT
ncbi:hypothetical protein WJX74_007656 [Apatococcus lobatus]|uniref:Uncharacterized protein n=1 Tax=Apatococcus lobatus TaxID=904363 RepID=A0AAW1SGU9_9CHLO